MRTREILYRTDLIAVYIDSECVGITGVVEQQQSGEESGAELCNMRCGDPGEAGVREDPADLVEIVGDALLDVEQHPRWEGGHR